MLNGVTNRGIRLTGTVNTNWTLQNYGYPYFITASITVNTGATFTIADNTVINTTGAFALNIGSSTTSVGNIIANLVTFQGITTSTADQLSIKFSTASKITNCNFTAYDINCLNTSPEIKNNAFNNAFISLNEASPLVQDNSFENVTYPVEFANECSPNLSNMIMLSGVINRGIKLTGTVNTDWTLQNYGYPYFVTASITVNAGAKFTIAQNDTINLTGAYSITAGTATTSLGSIVADKVIFKGFTTSTTDQLAFKFGSGGKVTNCSFAGFDVTCANASNPEIKNNSFDNAFISLTESSPIIQDNTFDNVAYPVLFIDECSPVLSNLNMNATVTNRGIRFTGTVNTDWTLQNYGYPYFVTATITVNAGATFTIAENDTINFTGGYAINIGSSASSLGNINANKIIFKGVTNSTADQIAFKFGSTGKVTNCSFTAIDLTCSASNPEISNNYFDNAFISLTESSPTIQDNTFDNVAYPVLFIDECSPVLTNLNMLNGVTNHGIRLTGTVNKDWTLQNYSYPYFMTNTLTVNAGAIFTIAKGDTIKIVAGYALAAGTSSTSLGTILADSVIFQGVTNTTSDQLAFRFGSTGRITNCSFTAIDITSTISSPEIRNNSFNNAFISLNESSAEINDNTFDNVTYPVEFVNECTPTITNLIFGSVTYPGIKISGTINSDWTLQNYSYPYYMPTTLTVNTGATFTSAPGNTIFFNGVNLAVGSSTTSIGKFYAKANSFRNLRTTDNIIYFRYGAEGVLDSCDFIGIRIHTDASNPRITRSKFHKSQNAFYTANNANPEILNNIFYNNTLALKNAGTNTITAKNNYWGHKSGPMHPNNPNGIGEKIEGLVDFSDFSEKPVYGNTVYSISTNTLAYDSIPVGNFQDKVITLKSFGDIDLLFADILTPDPSFLIQIPANKRAWIEKDDSLNFTVRFKPQEPIEYDINAFVRTNNIDESEIPLHLTGNGLPILKITPDSISFDSVYYGNTHIQYIKIENVSSSNSIMVDSIVNTNHKFLIYKTITPALSKIKAETETAEVAEATETRIITNGFSVSKTTPAYIAVQYLPYQSLNDEDEISIYYNAGALHKIKVKSSTYADELSTKVISLDARQFPNIYMNVQVDTFAVSHNGLTEKDIEVYENGVLQTEGFKVIPPGQGSNTRLTDIVFMMDNSGSMSDEQAQVRNNVSNFVSNLSNKGIDYAIGLCRYGASVNAGNPIIEDNGALSLDYQYFRDVVWNRNVVSGGTEPGYYAIMQSASNFKFRSGSQKIFIIITDETPQQGSIGKLQLAIEACINQKITLYAFTMTDLFHLFTPITNVTNGRVFNITSSFDLILDYISNMVTNNYVIQYTSSEPVLNGVRRNVEVKVKYKNIEASDTTSYVPGAIPKITRTSPTLQLHNKAWEPGTQLTIEVEVKDDIEPFVNSVTLYCRTTKTSTYTAIQMTSTDNVLYRGTIPASLVLEPGVEYYITATDGVTSSDAPSIDAINNPYQIAVLPNTAPVIEHTPVTEGYFRNDILIHALVTDNTNFVSSVELYYRKSGQLVFNKHTLTHTGNNNYETNISGRYSTLEDIEYYIKATDDFGVSSFSGLPESPHSIKMQNASGLEINKNVNNIHIYPNPVTNGRFIISLDNTDFAQNFRITLMNATGMKLAEIHNEFLPIGSNKIPVQVKDVNSGIYFIEITTETGVYYRKLVVE